MLKRILAVLLSVSLLLACGVSGLLLPASAAATDLIGDGDFEGNLSSHWVWSNVSYGIINPGSSPINVYTESDGNKCLQLPGLQNADKTEYVKYDRYYKSAPVEAGKKYRLELKYKGEGLYVYFHTSYCASGSGSKRLDAAAEWTDFSHTFTMKTDSINTNFVFAFGHLKEAGATPAYIDDVKLYEVVETEGIAFTDTAVSLEKGETKALTLTAQPDGAEVPSGVTYTSNNTAVATVSADGVVTAKADGVAYITARAGDFTATCTVIVESPLAANLLVDGDLQKETLSTNWANFTSASASTVITHTTDPDDATNRVLKFVGSKAPNYKSISGIKGDTYYQFSFRHKGKGDVRVAFTKSYVDTDTVVLDTTNYTLGNTANDIRLYIDTKSDWQTINIVFKTTASPNTSWVLQFGSYGDSTELYLDDFSLVELGKAAVSSTVGSSVSLSSGSVSGQELSGLSEGAIVTATVTPKEGYLMVPGSLRYMTSGGKVKRILNKAEGEFGEGNGNSFAFVMPQDNVRILADFVSTEKTDFAWGTIGTAVRYKANGDTDGIRFLTRINMPAFDASGDALTFKYEGETYTVKEIGQMLKRATNETELTVENAAQYATAASAERIWNTTVYSSANNVFRLLDYTENYVDHTIVMTTSNPSEEFNSRVYTARGYIVLEKNGDEVVLYADERSDSVNTAIARANGEIDDEYIGGDLPEVPVEPEEPEEPEDTSAAIPDDDYDNADLKILSIGNSYSQDAHKYLAKLAAAEGKTFKTVNLYSSGCALKTHYEKWASNTAFYDYELNGTKTADPVSLKAVLESDQFDVITLQQASWTSVSYTNYQPYLNDLITAIREKQPNAKLYLQQTWAYGDASSHHVNSPAHTGGTMAAMWTKIEAAYNAAAVETGLTLIPSGQAIQTAQEMLNAGGYSETSIQRDQAHVSYTWGRYLLARVWYQALTGDVPTVALNQLNSSVAADAAMEALVAEAAAAAFAEYPANPV